MTVNPYRRLFLLLFIPLFLAGCPTAELNGQGAVSRETGPAPAWQNKLAPSLIVEIEQLKSEHREAQGVDVLVKTRGALDPVQRRQLEKRGARIGSVLGDIATARIPASRVEDVANLEFVVFIEKAKKLLPKRNQE